MTPEDFERSLVLARFMGWKEAQTQEERDFAETEHMTCFATFGADTAFGAPDTIVIYPWERRQGYRSPYDWLPLSRPDQADAVMQHATVMHNWVFEIYVSATIAQCRIQREPLGQEIGKFSGRSPWPWAVCLATLEAVESMECAAEMERALAR